MARNSYKLTPDQIAQCKEKLQNVIDEVLKTKKEQTISSHDLYGAFGKSIRRKEFEKTIRKRLFAKDIEIKDNPYTPRGCDNVTLFRTPFLETKLTEDPVRKVSYVPSASHKPSFVCINDNLKTATDIMEQCNFSQLPVLNNASEQASIVGYISWQTIGMKQSKGVTSERVEDYIEKKYPIIGYDKPLVEVIEKIDKHDFVIVMKNETNKSSMCGIITLSDLATLFFNSNQPFFLLNEIEYQLRMLLSNRIALKDVTEVLGNQTNLDALTLGKTQKIFEQTSVWKKLKITSFQHQAFKYMLEEVRAIRNKAMHFRPEGLQAAEIEDLHHFADLLKKIRKEIN